MLLKFTPYTIPTQSLNFEKFERALNSKIKDYLLVLKIKNIVDLENKAIIIEDNMQIKEK